MNSSVNRRRIAVFILLASLLMRAGIPDGYMPAAPGSGLLFELCPSGVPAEFMQMLGGGHHHHGSAGDTTTHFDASQCPIGHMLGSAVAAGDFWELDASAAPHVFVATPDPQNRSRLPAIARSRDPPA
jgi:hypothetical protein